MAEVHLRKKTILAGGSGTWLHARWFWNKSCDLAIVWNVHDLAIGWLTAQLNGSEVSLSGKVEVPGFKAADTAEGCVEAG